MNRTKLTIGFLLTAILLITQVIGVGAAPVAQEITPTTTIESVTIETDTGTGAVTVIVVLVNDAGTTKTVNLNLHEAAEFGFVLDDGTGKFVPNAETTNTQFEFNPVATPSVEEEKEHPVGSAIADFFSDTLGVDYETVMTYHDDGVGFGVIAQALWMTNALGGDTTTFAAILEAKQNNDFSTIPLNNSSTPENWGQFRKAVMSDREKSKENLGAIMSGHAENDPGSETQDALENNSNSFDSLDGDEQEKRNNGQAPDKGDKSNNGNKKDKDKSKNKNK